MRAVGGRSGLKAITSTEDAVRLMGLDSLKRWITLLSISGLDDACHTTNVEGMVLSYTCRDLGRLWFGRHAPSLQLCGGLSVIPNSLGMEMTRLMRTLDLREDVQDALSGFGPWAELVNDVLAARRGMPIPHRTETEQQEIRSALLRGEEEARITRIDLGL
jgi:c-di-GMP-related signal transduction protein